MTSSIDSVTDEITMPAEDLRLLLVGLGAICSALSESEDTCALPDAELAEGYLPEGITLGQVAEAYSRARILVI